MEKKVKKTQKVVIVSSPDLNIHDKLRPGAARLATLKKDDNNINVAVKLFNAGRCPGEDLPMEARLMARLRHPNVVAFHGVVHGKGHPLVMEHLPNGDLCTVLVEKGELLPWESRMTVAGQVAEAMAYLHSRGVVHSALNASNVFLDLTDPDMPVCKVGNFEKAEQFQKENQNRGVAEKEDVYSFGILMWELLVGQPFTRQNYYYVHDNTKSDTSDEEGDKREGTDGFGERFLYANHVNQFHALASESDESSESTDDEHFHGKTSEKKRLEEEEEEVELPWVPEWCNSEWGRLMEDCWAANPAKRPSFKTVVKRIGAMEYIVEEHPGKIKGNRFWLAVVLISMLMASVMFLGLMVTSKKVDGK